MKPIDVDAVDEVMIGGVWYEVKDASFEVDAYRFEYAGHVLDLESEVGFGFVEAVYEGRPCLISGPLSAVQAVRYRRAAMVDPADGRIRAVIDIDETTTS